MAVARHHRLSPLLSITCGETLPAPLAEAFRRDRVVTAARNMILGQVAEECLRALAAAGIPTIVLKGLDYETRLYGAPGARPTADVDLLVPDEKRRAAFGVLDRLGFEPRAAAPGFDDPDYHEVAWTRAGVEIDLHMALAPLARCRIDYAAIWREAEPFRLGATETLRPRPPARRRSSTRCTWRSITSTCRRSTSSTSARLLPTRGRRRRSRRAGAPVALPTPLRDGAGARVGDAPRLRPLARPARAAARVARRVTEGYGSTEQLPRAEQLLRKLLHFDAPGDALRYVAVQSRRNLRETYERRFRHRSARERLALAK